MNDKDILAHFKLLNRIPPPTLAEAIDTGKQLLGELIYTRDLLAESYKSQGLAGDGREKRGPKPKDGGKG